jgi:hypothetical protein
LRTGIALQAERTIAMLHRALTWIAGAGLMLTLLGAVPANAQRAGHWRYNGGVYSRRFHSGWNRYWGGPGIGFYWAPTAVYVAPPAYYDYDYGYGPGYYDYGPYYGPAFYGPAFGLDFNFGGWGGGRYYGGGHYGGGHFSGGHRGGGGGHVGGGGGHRGGNHGR